MLGRRLVDNGPEKPAELAFPKSQRLVLGIMLRPLPLGPWPARDAARLRVLCAVERSPKRLRLPWRPLPKSQAPRRGQPASKLRSMNRPRTRPESTRRTPLRRHRRSGSQAGVRHEGFSRREPKANLDPELQSSVSISVFSIPCATELPGNRRQDLIHDGRLPVLLRPSTPMHSPYLRQGFSMRGTSGYFLR
jgi:hypothetical protein